MFQRWSILHCCHPLSAWHNYGKFPQGSGYRERWTWYNCEEFMAQLPCVHNDIHSNCILVFCSPFSVPLHQKNESSHVGCQQYFLGLHWLLSLLCCRIQQVCWTPQKAQRRYKAGCADWFSGHIFAASLAQAVVFIVALWKGSSHLEPRANPSISRNSHCYLALKANHYTSRQPLHLLHHLY